MIANDENVNGLISRINTSIEESFSECKFVVNYLTKYSFLWTIDINQAFKEFLKGNTSKQKSGRANSRNFVGGAR